MNAVHKTFGRVCEHCPICNHTRNNKYGGLYKTINPSFHGRGCPA